MNEDEKGLMRLLIEAAQKANLASNRGLCGLSNKSETETAQQAVTLAISCLDRVNKDRLDRFEEPLAGC